MSATTIEWVDASTSTYTAEATTVGDYLVTVCVEDEGPLRPAFYWTVEDKNEQLPDGRLKMIADGWSGSVAKARRDAINTATASFVVFATDVLKNINEQMKEELHQLLVDRQNLIDQMNNEVQT